MRTLRILGELVSTRKRTTKDGQIFYEIRVSRGRVKSYLTTRWYPLGDWGQKAIERALAKEAAEFERRCREGEVVSQAEQKKAPTGRNGRPQRSKHYGNTAKQFLCLPKVSP